jgi:hypothetical protein
VLAAVILSMPMSAMADPPTRPHELTATQYQQLIRLESQPQHVAVQELHASYASEREINLEATRAWDDALTYAYNIGFPTGILILLIAAAPL